MTKPPSWGSSPEQGQRAQLLPTELLLDCTWIMLDTTRPVTAPPHQSLPQGWHLGPDYGSVVAPKPRISHQRQERLGISLISSLLWDSRSPKHILLCPVSPPTLHSPACFRVPHPHFIKWGTWSKDVFQVMHLDRRCKPCDPQYINIPAHRMTTQKTKLETIILSGLSSNKNLSLHPGQKGACRTDWDPRWISDPQSWSGGKTKLILLFTEHLPCANPGQDSFHTWSNSSSHKKSVT